MRTTASIRSRFSGFSQGTFTFLRQLEANNNRDWFREHRHEYEAHVLRPALDLVHDLGPPLRRRIASGLRVEARVDGSIVRVQRDARFARDEPYKSYLELWFWQGSGPSRANPGFFARVTADHLVLGAGLSTFPPEPLQRYRGLVDHPTSGRELVALLHRLHQGGWDIAGRCLRRVPRPYSSEHDRGQLLRLLGLRVQRAQPLPDEVMGPELPKVLLAAFVQLRPLHRWLVKAL
jgi:uncharacterized protein (TIGR02453 family)